jgi:peptidoglycan/LPS O-acetylase OafA/YrhL
MSFYEHRRAVRILSGIFALAVVVSIIHYTDNYVNFDDYPEPTTEPKPIAALVPVFWVGFTAAGLAGYLLFRRRPSDRALVLVAAYSGSGLIGILHYVVPGATSMPWWRQAHVCLDIACGIAMFSFAIWAARARHRGHASPAPRQVPQ